MGLTYLVFPGASHNRFEHSLGTCHLANGVFTHLYRLQKTDLGVDPKVDGEVVALAVRGGGGLHHVCALVCKLTPPCCSHARPLDQGLCHDLGHGPFSHVFDTEFLPRRLGSHHHADVWYGFPRAAEHHPPLLDPPAESQVPRADVGRYVELPGGCEPPERG